MKRPLRVVIVGAQGFRRFDERVQIECFPWPRVGEIPNPSDYDRIILNLTSLTDRASVNWDRFFEKFTVRMTLDVLMHNGEIVIIGDPRFWPVEPRHVPGREEEGSDRSFLSWTGLEFQWDARPGETKKFTDSKQTKPFLNYIERISGWDYALKQCRVTQLSKETESVLGKRDTEFGSKIEVERILENRYDGLLIFAIRLSITIPHDPVTGAGVPLTVKEGRMVFLPSIEVSEEDVVAMVLTDILGIRIAVPEPPWATNMVAPGQPEIDQRIEQMKRDIADLEGRLKNGEEERESARRCVHLLYKMDVDLEEVVREVFAALGAEVEPPDDPGKEDGWVSVTIGDENSEGVLEIKATKKDQFNQKGLRQLMEWKNRGILHRQKTYKGIFIGNSGAEKDLSERAVAFAPEWSKSAQQAQIVALDTRDLYTLYCLNCEGKLDTNQFWRTLFQTNGIFDANPFLGR